MDWVLDVPMYFVYRDGTYLNATGMSFKDWMAGKLPLLPGTYPTLDDWEQHLSTVFPEVRMKKFLEMRGADGGPFKRICALRRSGCAHAHLPPPPAPLTAFARCPTQTQHRV